MSRLKLLLQAGAAWFLLFSAAPAFAVTVNALGTASAAVSVSNVTATKVVAGNAKRLSFSILPEGADIRCMPGGADDTANATSPTSTVGFLFKSNILVTEGGGTMPSDISAAVRMDCIAVGGAPVPVDTWEDF